MNAQVKKPGVYLCSGCGIGEAVSAAALEKVAVREYKIPAPQCKKHDYLCGEEGLKMIAADVAEGTNQVIIAACSPRANVDKFRFDGAQVIRANLREQVVWTQEAGKDDTEMAASDYLRMALVEARKSASPSPYERESYCQRVLVVGGGLSGLTAAKETAAMGYDVLLVEASNVLGGHSRRWAKRIPHLPPYRDPQDNDIEDLITAVKNSSRIEIRLSTRVTKTSGAPTRYTVELAQDGGTVVEELVGAIVLATGWRPYDATKLTRLGYGKSLDIVTSVAMEEMLAAGAVKRRSDSKAPKTVAFVQCAGSRDPDHLPYCSSVCCQASLKQAIQIRKADPQTSVYIIYEEMRTPGVAEEFFRAAQTAGVIFIKGKVKDVTTHDGLAVIVDDELLRQEVPLAGLDMVVLATGMVPNSVNMLAGVEGEDLPEQDINPMSPIPVAGYCNGGTAPEVKPRTLVTYKGAPVLNLQYRQGPHLPVLSDGFADSHFICFPYETRRTGIYTCGPVRRPMDMAEAAEDATGAALKAIQAIRNIVEGRALHPRSGDLSFPKVNLNPCTKCRRCTVECPFGAIDETPEGYPVFNPERCRRCGTCMGACPVRAISFENYSVDMLTSMIKAVEVPEPEDEKPRVLVLACQNDAYPALDMAGIARSPISPYIRVLPVRCLGSVSLLCVSDALSSGYDGVMMMGCKSGDDYQCHFVRGSAMAQERMMKVGETLKSMMLEKERVATYEIAIGDAANMPKIVGDFMEMVEKVGPNPFKGM
jgi:quinone-modifying oxidoreductase, subunit QmoB